MPTLGSTLPDLGRGGTMADCTLCNEPLEEAPVVGTRARGGRMAPRVSCSRCGLISRRPMPSADELAHYYASGEFWADHQTTGLVMTNTAGDEWLVLPGTPEHAEAMAQMHRHRAAHVVRDLDLEPGSRVLEVGCAKGLTLVELQRLGMEVHGVEADRDEAMAARDLVGPCVWACSLADVGERMIVADALIAFHVLEHFPDPLAELARMRSLLKPGGRVWLEVPNAQTPGLPLAEHWLWAHTHDYTPDTLRALLLRAGFDDVHVYTHGNLPSKPGRLLRAWATNGAVQSRAYADHGGPGGETFAAYLRKLDNGEASEVPTGAVLQRFMAGESVRDLGEDAEQRLRAELARVRDGSQRLATAYHEATDLVGTLCQRYTDECYRLFESWHADPYTHGTLIGKAQGFHAAKDALAYVGNVMRVVELTDAARSESEGT